MPDYNEAQLKVDGVNINAAVETVTGDKTLTEIESGKVFALDGTVGADIVLPTAKAGLKYRFIVATSFATSNWTVATATALGIIQGLAVVNGATVAAAGEDSINFAFGAETVGDWIEVICDGTNWYANGQAAGAGGITFTS